MPLQSGVEFRPSANVAGIGESATIAVSARAKALAAAGRPVIDLGAGEPDASTPEFVCRAARAAIAAGATRYTPVAGIAPLRATIAQWANDRLDARVPRIGEDEVVVTTGSKQALFNACYTLFGAGDEVLVPTPAWTSYYEMIALARATAVPVRGARETDLRVTPSDLRAAATPATRGLVLNSPCNPTGALYDRDELGALLDLAAEQGWWVISDEIYRRIAYDGEAPSSLDAARARDRLVVVDGVAKAYAMTGWRIGWAIAPAPVARAMTALQSHTTSNASSVSQHAALAALTCTTEADASVRAMVNAFRERRDEVLAILREAGADVIEPRGAFYLFVRVGVASAADPEPGTTFARRLLEEDDVAVVPGSAFRAPEWIRLSYAAPLPNVLTGARAVAARLAGRRATAT
jgi:aspartate aminotransferase